jgi:hypothetical protein
MRLYCTAQLEHNPDKSFIIAKVALWTYVSLNSCLTLN